MPLLEKKISVRTLVLTILAASAGALWTNHAHAATPGILSYQGRVLVNNAPFTGTGQFMFALVDMTGATTYWSNDNTSTAGSQPSAAVSLPVANGLYSVLLGDTTVSGITQAIPATVFSNADVRLRVWFNDGTNGSKLLSPDQRIAPVGYAMIANSVSGGTVDASRVSIVGGSTGTPFSVSVNDPAAAAASFGASGANTQPCILSSHSGLGRAADFHINNATNSQPTILVDTNGTGPAASFSVSNNNATISCQQNGVGFALLANQSGPNGNIAIFESNGSGVATIAKSGAYAQSSDARLKTNVNTVTKSLEKVIALRGVTFDWKDERRQPSKHDIGFIAQELLPIVPEAVTEGDDGYYSVAYSKVIPILVEALKELKKDEDAKADLLKQEVRALREQNADLESRLKRLEELLAK